MVESKQPKQILALASRLNGLPGDPLPLARGNGRSNDRGHGRILRLGAQTGADPEVDTAIDAAREEPWTILVHNDDVTPFDFVVDTLSHIFSLSAEIAETVTWEAHSKGVAPVCSRPRAEAKRLISDAHARARSSGYPLSFSMEPKS